VAKLCTDKSQAGAVTETGTGCAAADDDSENDVGDDEVSECV
jgi:hypothetical protein